MTFKDNYGASVFAEMQAEVVDNVIKKGWRTGINTFGDYVALLHTEVSEMIEAFRDHGDFEPHSKSVVVAEYAGLPVYGDKPIGVDNEAADVLIRLLDTCDVFGIDLFAAYETKMRFNRTRPYQHGGRALNNAGVVNHDES